jgi:hypothetical protein
VRLAGRPPMRKAIASLTFLSLVLAVAGGLMWAELRAPETADTLDMAMIPPPAPGRTPFWGRPAHQPDWQGGDAVDRAASAVFLRHWLPGLETCRGAAGDGARAPRPTSRRRASPPRAARANPMPSPSASMSAAAP